MASQHHFFLQEFQACLSGKKVARVSLMKSLIHSNLNQGSLEILQSQTTDGAIAMAPMKHLAVSPQRAMRHLETRKVPQLSEVEGRFKPPGRGLRFWTVLRACAGHGDPYRVKAWLDRAQAYQLPVDVRVANSLIHAYAKVADLRAAEKSLLGLIRQGHHPSTESFNAILAACARNADISSALKWFQRLVDADLTPDKVTYRTMVSVSARAGNLPLAEEWLGKMLDTTEPKLDVVSCSSLIGGYASQGDAQNAQKWLERMLLAGLRPGAYAFNPVICAWSYLEASKAEAWLWKAMESGVKPSDTALQRTLDAFVKQQNLEGCDRMKQLLQQLHQWPAAWALALLAKPHAAAGDFEVVEGILEELAQCPEVADHELQACLRALLAAYARSPRNPKDRRVELCCERLFKLKSSRDATALGDARRALGQDGYQRLAEKLGLETQPLIQRKWHARSRVVGTWQEISPG